MKQRLWNAAWAQRQLLERCLIVSLVVVVVCLGLTFAAWMTELRPWAPVWGTWADWVAAAGTVLGFAAAVITLAKNASDQKDQRKQDVLAEASRVVLTLGRGKLVGRDPVSGTMHYTFAGNVHNDSSSPIRKVNVGIDVSQLQDQVVFLHHGWDLETIPAGGQEDFLVQLGASGIQTPPGSNELSSAMRLLYTDVHGLTWNQKSDRLTVEKRLAAQFSRDMN